MINLLPSEIQKEIKSRRINLILFKYLIALSASAAFLAAASLSTGIFLNIAKNSADQEASLGGSSVSNSTSIRLRLENSNTILSQQKSYSKLMLSLSDVLPEGVVLDSIKINKISINSSFSAEFIVNQSITLEKLKTDLENSSLINNVTLSPIAGETENKVSALLTINPEALK